MTDKPIILAAGGTGGHLFPAESLAQELLNRNHRVVIITDKRGNAFKTLGDKVEIKCVNSATFKAGIASKIKALIDLKLGCIQSFFILLKYKPSVVVGFGGYPSFPPMLMAQLLGVKTVMHEQNAVLGKANIWLAMGVTKIATAFPDTKRIKESYKQKIEVTGNPVRAAICEVRNKPYPEIKDSLNILITGGSQGAKVFSTIIPDAIVKLPADIKDKLNIVQQCKPEDIEEVKKKYSDAGVKAEIKSFFDDMNKRLEACHLFIGRAGASTVTELAVAGRPAIFIPYPGHEDNQQRRNAETLTEKGGAWVVDQKDFTEQYLVEKLENLAKNPDMLQNAALVVKNCGKPEAVKNLADVVEGVISK